MRTRLLRPRFVRTLALTVVCAVGFLAPGTASAAPPDRPADASAAAPAFQQVTLAKGVAETGEPMTLTVLPDRSVLHTSRDGTVRRTDANGNTAV
ncbi:MAG: glycosyl hydrolase, partial [Streptomyces sp.]|nr:glycosyl hydrolase [Streptomyces sp.]